ncbi:hypothetical protein P171DRAFT_25306 [Karstenula rhodostoma CBS 690.94]|uniref:Peptidase M12A domain-containing protein n=1 Tax=Karstenula rhodostoma CBS 690.94 TaxID=1392251 RepID=A0A9P4PFG6_9PLEO|nr:hypothetical protein P171DRAFT_25306 [Karstenula rhodostoma CBS 690.94]
MIMVDQRVFAANATPGWNNGNQQTSAGESAAGRHRMRINNALARWYLRGQGRNFRTAKAAVAHEFGHIFGLDHEHQRGDRDRYIFFDCTILNGYPAAYAKVQAARQAGSTDSIVIGLYFPCGSTKVRAR